MQENRLDIRLQNAVFIDYKLIKRKKIFFLKIIEITIIWIDSYQPVKFINQIMRLK